LSNPPKLGLPAVEVEFLGGGVSTSCEFLAKELFVEDLFLKPSRIGGSWRGEEAADPRDRCESFRKRFRLWSAKVSALFG
jgi:hypothetical protein